MSTKPIKRHRFIQPLSRDHHHSLLLGWKIRTGLRHQVEPERIFQYLKWYYDNYLISHFKEEETLLFPILGINHKLVKQAIQEHQEIHLFFEKKSLNDEELSDFGKKLTAHIRFEERELFNKIQEQANVDELSTLHKHLEDTPFVENTEDEFWLTTDKTN